jgi:hypothetical protein
MRLELMASFEHHNVTDSDPGGMNRLNVQDVSVSNARQHAPALCFEAEPHTASRKVADQRGESM